MILFPLSKTPVVLGVVYLDLAAFVFVRLAVSKFSKEFRCDFSHPGKGLCGRQAIPVEIRLLFMDWGTVMHTSCDVPL